MKLESLISVIIPVYNLENYIAKCLDSVINQTYKNLEIIVVNDGSSDSSKEIIDNYAKKDKRIIAIHKKNTGVSDTRNRGIDIAKGEYIGFVDGDDSIEKNMFEKLVENMVKYDADISHCGYKMIFPASTKYFYNTGKIVIQDNKKGIIDLIRGDYIEPGIWNKLYKRSVIGNIRMPVDIKNNEDYLFNIEVFQNAEKSVYEDKPFYNYIQRENSAVNCGVSEHKIFDCEIVRKQVFEKYKDDKYIHPYSLYNLLKSNVHIFRILETNKEAKKYKYKEKEIKNNIKSLYKQAKSINILDKRLKIDCIMSLHFPLFFKFVYTLYEKYSKARGSI